ncbi:PREDICTED: tripartite motif-containing protein 45 [Drosophila arizonae]|uniref:Tripartite motif-containing protein 45 n=1 Tax=Drosophila arizonae TaxID=7263 RepID=A0ABM1NRG0_DROAR|nr:PREDICTED: tripartite motif-containing protein 45 [Drosophila arizonae]
MSKSNSKLTFKRHSKSNLLDYERLQLSAAAPNTTAAAAAAAAPTFAQVDKMQLKLSTSKIKLQGAGAQEKQSEQVQQAQQVEQQLMVLELDALRRKSAPQLLSFSIAPAQLSAAATSQAVPRLPAYDSRKCIRRSRTELLVTDSNSDPSTSSLTSSTSPESLLDNVLSEASAASVPSTSSASDITVAPPPPPPPPPPLPPPPSKLRSSIIPPQPRRLLNLKSSPELRVSPPTPDLEVSNLLLPSAAASDYYETASQISRSYTPSPAGTPQISPSSSLNLPGQATSYVNIIYPEDLKCAICMDVFTDPRTLHCLHSFCLQCLVNANLREEALWEEHSSYSLLPSTPDTANELATISPARQRGSKKSLDRLALRGKRSTSACSSSMRLNNSFANDPGAVRSIRCHSCQFVTELPALGGVRQLPQNFLLVRRIEALRLQAGEDVISKVWCSLCSEEINATYHCISCTLNLCSLCKEAHERQRSTSNHHMRNILELRRARKQKQQQFGLGDSRQVLLKCGLHGFELKSFCISCQQLACPDCLVLQHRNHRHETVAKAMSQLQMAKKLSDATEQTRPLCQYAEHSIERLREITRSINARCDDIQAQVESYMNRYFEALQAHRNTLLQQVNRARESKVELIINQQLELEKRTQQAMEAIRFGQELSEIGADVEILSFARILLKRFEYCQQFKPPVDPKISDSLHFLSKIRAPGTKEQHDIPLYGIITMQTVEPSLCTLQWEGFSQLRLHRKVDLQLLTRDADGVALCHGGLEINCMIKYKDANVKYLPVEVSDHRDGTYSISFTPDTQGTLLLMVSINDRPIKGSPYTFHSRQVRPHTGIYHCCAFCSSKGNKSVKCSCEGRMPGYSGCGHGHAGHPGRRHWSCCGNVLENSECSVANKLLNS